MTRSDSDDKSVLLLNAYLDGELDPANALGVTQQIDKEPALASEAERIKALRQSIYEQLPPEEAPPGLRAENRVVGRRCEAGPRVADMARARGINRFNRYCQQLLDLAHGRIRTTANHDCRRARLRSYPRSDGTEPVDVTSTDRHTVKPWFNGRITSSPRVVDLATEDFTLIGGRVDVVARSPVSTLVYRRAKHLISLTAMPAESRFELDKSPRTVSGYNVVRWVENGVSYWAVSDLEAKQLEHFARLFRTSKTEL